MQPDLISFLFSFFSLLIVFLITGYIIVRGLTGILFFISEQTALTKIYHEISSDDKTCEKFSSKILKISACNFNLSVPIILTFLFIIKNTVGDLFNSDKALFVSLIFTIGSLVSLRLLSNPTKKTFRPKTILYFKDGDQKINEIKIYQERISSFFFSFISATIIFILVAFLYIFFNGKTSPTLPEIVSIIMPTSSIQFSPMDFFTLFICYTVTLFTFTILGEIILKRDIPLLQMK